MATAPRYPAKQRKYLEGQRVQSMTEVLLAIDRGEYLMVRGKPTHPAVVVNYSVATLRGFVENGYVNLATINPLYREPKRTEQPPEC